MIKRMNTENIHNETNQDHIEIEMMDANDGQIRDNLIEIEPTNNMGRQTYYRLVGRFMCNVMFITVAMLLFTGIGVILGLVISAIRHKHDIF